MRLHHPALAVFLTAGAGLLVETQQQERLDLNALDKIRHAVQGNPGAGRAAAPSSVMDIAWTLTDRYGPRLTNSPQFRAAGEWAAGQLRDWGLSNVRLEKWPTAEAPHGPVPGWQVTGYSGAMVQPSYMPLIGVPVAWTPGTHGPLTAEVLLAPVAMAADLDRYKGKAKGKIVLTSPIPELAFPDSPLARRYTDSQLANIAQESVAAPVAGPTPDERLDAMERESEFWKKEGALMTIQATVRGQSGTLFGDGAPRRGDPASNLPQVSLTAEHYNRIARLVQHGVPVRLTFDVKTEFDSNTDSFNVVGEIPGATKPDEVVLIGAHFDSWHYGTGATDNAAGCAVAMEALRVLKSLNLRMDRTVRLALWGGEEQGLLGSEAYVKAHFGDPAAGKPSKEYENFTGYFNTDRGTGRIQGVYLQGNQKVRPIFESWFSAVRDLAPGAISARRIRFIDNSPFDDLGLPGFYFLQDPMDYATRTHHSNMDTFDHLQRADLEQMAVIEAWFIYNAATRPEKLPRSGRGAN
jgi:hypothetical protein